MGLKKYWVTKDPYFHLITTLFGVFINDYWGGYRYSINCKPKNKNVVMRQYEPLIVSDILDNPFTDVTLEDIGMSLPLLGGSLMGDRERHPCSDGENDRTSQARVEIEIMDLCS